MKDKSWILFILLGIIIGVFIAVPFINNYNPDKYMDDCSFAFHNYRMVDYNGTLYGGYNCYKRGDYYDIYFTPQVKKNDGLRISGDVTNHLRCLNNYEVCFKLGSYLKLE